MKIALTLLFLISIPHLCFSQSEKENWKARNELYHNILNQKDSENIIKDVLGLTIESVVGISNITNKDGRKFASVQVLASKTLDIEKTFLSNYSEKELDSLERKGKVLSEREEWEFFKVLCRDPRHPIYKEFAPEKVVFEDNEWSAKLVDIPLKLYCASIKNGKGEESWVMLPNPKSMSNFLVNQEKQHHFEEYFDKFFSDKDIKQLDSKKDYFKVVKYSEKFKKEGALLRKKDLNKAVAGYVRSIKEQIAEFELEWTHPKLIASLQKESKEKRKRNKGYDMSQIRQKGLINLIMKINDIDNISEVITFKDQKYALIALTGSSLLDMSKAKGEGGMGLAISAMMLQLKLAYGENNVSFNKESWVFTINNTLLEVYAIYDPKIKGWRFSLVTFLINKSLPKNYGDLSMMEYLSLIEETEDNEVDYIVPKQVFIKLHNMLQQAKKDELTIASNLFLETIKSENIEKQNNWLHPQNNIESGVLMDEGLSALFHFEALDSIYEVINVNKTIYAVLGFKGKLNENHTWYWNAPIWLNNDHYMMVAYLEEDSDWKFVWSTEVLQMLNPRIGRLLSSYRKREKRRLNAESRKAYHQSILDTGAKVKRKNIIGKWWSRGSFYQFYENGTYEVSNSGKGSYTIDLSKSPIELSLIQNGDTTLSIIEFEQEDHLLLCEHPIYRSNKSYEFDMLNTQLLVREDLTPSFQSINIPDGAGQPIVMSEAKLKVLRNTVIQSLIELDKERIIAKSNCKIDGYSNGKDCQSILEYSFEHEWIDWQEMSFGLKHLKDEQLQTIKLKDGREIVIIHFTGKGIGSLYYEVDRSEESDSRSHFLLLLEYTSNEWKLNGHKFERRCSSESCIKFAQKDFWRRYVKSTF